MMSFSLSFYKYLKLFIFIEIPQKSFFHRFSGVLDKFSESAYKKAV